MKTFESSIMHSKDQNFEHKFDVSGKKKRKKKRNYHLERNLLRPKTKAPQGTCRDLSN